jgi:hypothetical protein
MSDNVNGQKVSTESVMGTISKLYTAITGIIIAAMYTARLYEPIASIRPLYLVIACWVIVGLSVIINYIAIIKTSGFIYPTRLLEYIPTNAAIFRTIAAFAIPIFLLTEKYTHIFVYLYILYYLILSFLYTKEVYHDEKCRRSRIAVDIIFAILIYMFNGGNQNPAWLMFLIPISTVSRYYGLVPSALLATVGILAMTLKNYEVLASATKLLDDSTTREIYLRSDEWMKAKFYAVSVVVIYFTVGVFAAEFRTRIKPMHDMMLEVFIGGDKESALKAICRSICATDVLYFNTRTAEYWHAYHVQNKDMPIKVNRNTDSEIIQEAKAFADAYQHGRQIYRTKNHETMEDLGRILLRTDPERKRRISRDMAFALYSNANDSYMIVINNYPKTYPHVKRQFLNHKLKMAEIGYCYLATEEE